MKVGILAEKPSAMRNFAKALGGEKGSYQGQEYVLVHARGHLYEFVDPHEMVQGDELQTKYKKWDISNLPWNEKEMSWVLSPKRKVSKTGVKSVDPDIKALLKSLKDTLSGCDEITIATDVDPSGEGELLALEIITELKLHGKKLSRMYFTDEAAPSIQKAFLERKPIDINTDMDYWKARYRAQFDYLTMQFTRVATACADGQSMLRQGRLKSAMVVMVGDQLTAIKEYKKVPFYQNKFRDENGNIYVNPDEPVFKTKAEVPQTYTDSPVVTDGTEHKKAGPKKLLDLASLSAILAGKGVKAKLVLDTYQKMYEAQIVSYPRTEDKTITPEQFNELLPLVDKIAGVVGVDTNLLTHRTPRSTHVKPKGAHGANRPGVNVPDSLAALSSYGSCAADIYVLLAKSYLAMLAEDYEYDVQSGHLEKYPDFKGSVSIPVKAGWKAVFNADADEEDDGTGKLLGKVASPFIHEGFPPKPAAPTMKWLMKQLEKKEIGTGATRTSTYAEVTSEKAKYSLLAEKKGKIEMTEYGELSYKILPGTHIGSLELTKEVEQDMADIAAGKTTAAVCLQKVQQYVKDDIAVMTENGKDIPKRRSVMDDVERFEGTWNGKAIKPKRVFCGHRFTDEEVEKLLNGEEIEIYDCVSSKGTTYGVRGKLEEGEYEGHKYVGFKRLDFANKPGVPDSFCQHTFTDAEKKQLEAGEAVWVEKMKSKAGKLFDSWLIYDTKNRKLSFANKVPKTFLGRKLTDTEINMLERGEKVKLSGMKSKAGKTYDALVIYNRDTSRIDFADK